MHLLMHLLYAPHVWQLAEMAMGTASIAVPASTQRAVEQILQGLRMVPACRLSLGLRLLQCEVSIYTPFPTRRGDDGDDGGGIRPESPRDYPLVC